MLLFYIYDREEVVWLKSYLFDGARKLLAVLPDPCYSHMFTIYNFVILIPHCNLTMLYLVHTTSFACLSILLLFHVFPVKGIFNDLN